MAIGAVAGKLVGDLHPAIPKPLVHIAGKRDQRVKFDDQKDTVKEARKLDEANGKGEPCGQDCTLFASKIGDPVLFKVHDGGHVYPPWATDVIVKFFKEQGRE